MNRNKNYKIMKFFEPSDKSCLGKGYVKLDMRGNRGTITVNIENIGDGKDSCEVFLFKNKNEKIKIGPINNKRGKLQRNILLNGKDEPIENYNICGIVSNGKIVLYTPVFANAQVKQLNVLLGFENEEINDENILNEANDLSIESDDENDEGNYSDDENDENENNESNESNDNHNAQAHIDNVNNNYEIRNEGYSSRQNYSNRKVDNQNQEYINQNNNYQNPNSRYQNQIQNQNQNYQSQNYQNQNSNANFFQHSNTSYQNQNTDNQDVQGAAIPNKKLNNEKVYKNEYEKNLFGLLDSFEIINPLAHEIKAIKWWKVNYDEKSIYKGFLPYFNQIISTYYPYPLANHVTTCQNLMQRHGYYLFGIYEEDDKISKFVYGIPGKFTRDEQPYRGVTGFKNWSYKNNEIEGDYGYWLAFIDSKSGTITEPPAVE